MNPLRDYQTEDVEKVFNEWESVKSTLYVAATGLGKTRVMVEVARRMLPKRTMFLCHRTELIAQARKAFQGAGMDCEIEKAEMVAGTSLFNAGPVVLASVQTMTSGAVDKKRMARFKPKDFGLLLYDECFPAGTLVDERPIESLSVGDSVMSAGETGIEVRKIIHTFKRKPDCMVRVNFDSGLSLVSTHYHPVWCHNRKEFVSASSLDKGDMVFRLTTYEDYRSGMPELRTLVSVSEREKKALFPGVYQQAIVNANGCHKSQARFLSDEIEQSNEAQGDQGKNVSYAPCNGTSAGAARRKRKASDSAGNQTSICAWLGNWICGRHQHVSGERNPVALQAGRSESITENCSRSRWCEPSGYGKKRTRPEERELVAFDRVESVEILQRTSDGTFGGMCPDGYVYNIEVDRTCTYFANGVLVHNSHHSVSPGNKSIVDYFTGGNPEIRVLGVTATPDRADEEALGQIFETVASERDIRFGVDNGWLVEPVQLMAHIEDLDFSDMRTTAGDLNSGDLAAVMESEKPLYGVVMPTLEAMFDLPQQTLNGIPPEEWGRYLVGKRKPRRTIVFTVSVRQAEAISEIFNRSIDGISQWVCGKTTDEKRLEIFRSFQSGDSSVLVNCGVTTEGYDNPYVELIAMARPTKSRSLYSQCIGRGTRVLPGLLDCIDSKDDRMEIISNSEKPVCTVLDFVGNSGKHKLICTADVLGGKVSEAALERAVERARKSKVPVNMTDAMIEEEEKLQREMEQRKLQEAMRRNQVVAKVKYTTRRVNPFDALDLTPTQERGWDAGKTISERQAAVLRKQGLDPYSMSYGHARQILNEMFRRWGAKLCTMPQAATIKKHLPHVNTRNMTMERASQIIKQIADNGWRAPENLK
jgi:superfamily II DNA or RNA helicase